MTARTDRARTLFVVHGSGFPTRNINAIFNSLLWHLASLPDRIINIEDHPPEDKAEDPPDDRPPPQLPAAAAPKQKRKRPLPALAVPPPLPVVRGPLKIKRTPKRSPAPKVMSSNPIRRPQCSACGLRFTKFTKLLFPRDAIEWDSDLHCSKCERERGCERRAA